MTESGETVVEVAIDDLEASNVRRLTPTECELLQGFRSGYTKQMEGDSPRYAALGNSWATNCAEFVIRGIHREDDCLRMKYATVCSGIEAHSVAAESFGDDPLFFSEIEKKPCELLAARYPSVPNLGDLTQIHLDETNGVVSNRKGVVGGSSGGVVAHSFKDADCIEIPFTPGDLDIISGGIPCTDVSIAGKRRGMEEGSGTRSALAFDYCRIIGELKPRWIVYENVPGCFSSNGGRDFAWFVHNLCKLGYSIAWRTLDAEYVTTERFPRAIAQRRRRIWLVGRRGPHWQKAASVLFEPLKYVGWNPPQRWIGIGFDERFTDGRPIEHIAEDGDDPNGVDAQGDLFGGETSDSPSPRRVLHDADLRINTPKGRLGNVRSVELEAFARTIGTPLYNGGVFGKGKEPSPDSFAEKFLANIGNAGIMADGVVVTMKVPEWNAGLTEEQLEGMPQPKRDAYDGTVCGLSDILFETVDAKYDLSWKSCWGILRRAQARGKRLKVELEVVLRWRCIKYRNFVEWAMANAKKEADRANARRCFDEVIAPSWTDDLKPYLVPLDGKAAETASEEEDADDAEAVLDGDEVTEDAE